MRLAAETKNLRSRVEAEIVDMQSKSVICSLEICSSRP